VASHALSAKGQDAGIERAAPDLALLAKTDWALERQRFCKVGSRHLAGTFHFLTLLAG